MTGDRVWNFESSNALASGTEEILQNVLNFSTQGEFVTYLDSWVLVSNLAWKSVLSLDISSARSGLLDALGLV